MLLLAKVNDTDIVSDDLVSPIMEPGRERRFARPELAHESHRTAIDFDGVGMEWKQAALMQQHAEYGAKEV